MDDDGKTQWMVPKPVALVAENLPRIEKAYLAHRSDEEPGVALDLALVDVFNDDADPVVEYLEGTNDEEFGTKGREFRDVLIGQFEDGLAKAAELPAKIELWKRLDLVDFAESIATDRYLWNGFSGLTKTGGSFADRVVDMLLAKVASKARTKIGRRSKVSQALATFEILGAKAASAAASDPVARDQAAWCAAIAERLRPYSR